MRPRALPVLLAALLLTACGQPAPGSERGSPAAAPPSPTATGACPVQPGSDPPPDCAPYDPESAMALNDQYRERTPFDDARRNQVAPLVEKVRAALEDVRAAGGAEADVRDALEATGLVGIQTRTGAGDVLFGAVPPGGGCVFGAVEAEAITVAVGGGIMDGGCLPAQ